MSLPDLSRPPYDPSRGFVVLQPFHTTDRQLKAGDPFDPRLVDGDQRRLQQLWAARYIDCRPPAPPAPPASKKGKPPVLDALEASEHET